MARFDDWATDRAVTRAAAAAFIADPARAGAEFLDGYAVWTTSGATGEPAILVHDRRSLAIFKGVAAARNLGDLGLLWRLLRRGIRTAGVYAGGGHFLANAMTARRLRERPRLAEAVKVVSALEPLPAIVRELQAFQPVMLGGYPSALRLLAAEQAAGRLAIRPALITSGGEALSDADRGFIARAFGCPVTSPYACSEAGTSWCRPRRTSWRCGSSRPSRRPRPSGGRSWRRGCAASWRGKGWRGCGCGATRGRRW